MGQFSNLRWIRHSHPVRNGDSNRCHSVLARVFLDSHGRWSRHCRWSLARGTPTALPRVLRALPELGGDSFKKSWASRCRRKCSLCPTWPASFHLTCFVQSKSLRCRVRQTEQRSSAGHKSYVEEGAVKNSPLVKGGNGAATAVAQPSGGCLEKQESRKSTNRSRELAASSSYLRRSRQPPRLRRRPLFIRGNCGPAESAVDSFTPPEDSDVRPWGGL